MSDTERGCVLIHGAHHDARIWERVIPHIQGPVLAVDLPGRGDPSTLRALTVQDCASAVISEMRSAGIKRAVVVGHSLGGTVAYTVAVRAPKSVVSLVGIAAVFPGPGHSALSSWPAGLRWVPRTVLSVRPGGIDAPIGISPRRARRRLANDLNQDDTRWLLDRLGPETSGLSTTAVASAELEPAVHRAYLLCRRDKALKPSRQRRQAQMIGADIIEVDAGHDPMVGSPELVARILEAIDPPRVEPL